jgi:hypothetical protein
MTLLSFKNWLLSLVTMLIFCETSFAQTNWQPAYIVNLQGDTIKGLLDYWNWKRSPQQISFNNGTEPIKQYKPLDIKGFRVNDELYMSAIIDVETSPLVTKDLNQEAEVSLKIDTGFIQVLISGQKGLYRYTTQYDKEQFFISGEKGLELLVYKRYLKRKDQLESALSIIENKKFIGQLTLYFRECAEIQTKFEHTRYKTEDLMDVFEYYYSCSKNVPLFKMHVEKTLFQKGFMLGVSNSRLQIDNTSKGLKYMQNEFFNSSTNPAAGYYIDIILPKIFRKWSVNNELLINRAHFKGEYKEYANPEYYSITTTTLNYTYLTMNNMLRYKRNFKNYSIYGNLGIYNSYAVEKVNKKSTYTKFYATERTEEDEAFASRGWERGLLAGVGVIYKRYSADLRYTTGKGMSDIDNIGIYSNRFFLLLGYRL